MTVTPPDVTAGYPELADLLVGVDTYRDDPAIRDALVLTAMAQAYACGLKVGVALNDYAEPVAVIELPTGQVSFPLPTVACEGHDPYRTHRRCAAFVAGHYREDS